MGYKWLTYNTTTGALGAHEQTESPMIQTTSVTIGTNTPTITTANTNVLIPSANTTTNTDSEGTITTTTVTVAFDPHLIPSGQEVIGPFDGVTMTMSAEQQAAFDAPQAYLYQNGSFITNSAWATTELTHTQATQKKLLEQGYQATLDAGFQATISTGTYTFGWQTSDIAHMTALQVAVTQGWQTFPVQYADVNGNPLSIASQADLNTIEQTAQKFMTAQHQQVLSLIGQAQAATTVAGVNEIQWVAASY